MKSLKSKLPNTNNGTSRKVLTMLFPHFLLISLFSMPAWSGDEHEHEHEHEHEASMQHASHHKEGDHNEHEGHVDHDDDGHDHNRYGNEDSHGHSEEKSSRIEDNMASQVGIVTSIADAQELHQTITVFGSIVSAPEQLSHVRARFEGMIKSVKASIGDYVKTGDVLAKIESNESLQNYSLRSPISGRIVQRHANTGEMTNDQILFSVANFDTVWAELRIYPRQLSSVREGQSVVISTDAGSLSSTIDHVLPSLESPYQIARVKLANDNKSLSPGLMTEGRVEIGRFPVSLAIAKDAVQMLEGRQGVFVKQGEEYHFTPLVLGRSDDHFYEVIEGLDVGSVYVSQNSYLIKADIEKSEAEHEH